MLQRVWGPLFVLGLVAGCQTSPATWGGVQSTASFGSQSRSSPLPAGSMQRPAIAAGEACRARGLTGSAYADCFDAEFAARDPVAAARRTDTRNPDVIDSRARRECWSIAQPREVESFEACVRRRTAELSASEQSSASTARTDPSRPTQGENTRAIPNLEASRSGPPTAAGSVPRPSQFPAASGTAALRWEIERRSGRCMMHAVSGVRRLSLIARRGEIDLVWYEPTRPTMISGSLQRLRFEGVDGIWTVEAEAAGDRVIVFRGGSDSFAVRRIADVLGGGVLATTDDHPVRVSLQPAGRLTVEFLHCIDSLLLQQPSSQDAPRQTPQPAI